MTKNDNPKLSDDELDAYLAGKDKVSQAYRDLDQESPPRALDEKILARARQSVDEKPDFSKDVFIRPYATAATVFLCLAITFLLVREPGVPTPADLRSEAERLERAVPVTQPQESPRAPAAGNTQATSPADDAGAGAAPAQADNLANLPEDRSINATAAEAPSPARQRLEVDNATASTNQRAPAVSTAQARRVEDENADAAVAESASRTAQTLEEIAVSAFRVEDAPAYRDTREDWLREIARLREAGDMDRAGAEAALFLERFPEAELEAELAALESP